MNQNKLNQYLSAGSTRLYGVLDGAAIADLQTRIYEAELPNYCLFQGDLDRDLAEVAPFLVYLPVGHRFTQWLFSEGFGDTCGIFAHARASFIDVRRHFRSLANVYDANGNSAIFRYYDPRVLRRYLPTCTPNELIGFFGNVETIFAESEDGKTLVSFELENHVLKRSELN